MSYYSRGANNNALSTIGLVVLHKHIFIAFYVTSKKTIVEELQLRVEYVSESAVTSSSVGLKTEIYTAKSSFDRRFST